MQTILSLAEVRESDRPSVGHKAANLACLLQARFPVPDGFCITADTYQMQAAQFDTNELVGLRDMSSAERSIVLARIREELLHRELPSGFLAHVEDHYAAFAGHPVAVRSSANVEDTRHASSAGVYQSVLGVSNASACLQAVRRCWASFWTEQAFDYRESRGISHAQAGMGVLVQRVVSAEAAGVVFTRSPAGPPDCLLVEASYGLGETVVAGRVTPDRFVFLRKDGHPVERVIARKAIRLTVQPDGTAVEEAVPIEMQSRACVAPALLAKLVRLSLDLERHLGSPQDIEWAVAGDDVWILQSRPITTATNDARGLQIWSNLNAGEVLPRPISPMAHSLLDPCVQRSLILVLERLGMRIGHVDLTAQFAGRAYFNVNLLAGILRRLPKAFRIDLDELLGGSQEVSFADLDILDPGNVSFRWTGMVLGLPSLAGWFLAGALRTAAQAAERTNRQALAIRRLDVAQLTTDQLAGNIRAAAALVLECAEGLSASLVSMRYFEALAWVCRRWFPGEPGLASRLVAAGGEVDSAEAALALWRLAEAAHTRPAVAAAMLSERDPGALPRLLQDVPGGADFLQKWDDFLALHGHHAIGELDLATPRWSEDQATLLGHVRGYLQGMGQINPMEVHQRRAAGARESERRCLMALNPIQRVVFRYLVHSARWGAGTRENMKSALVRLLAAIRFLLLEQAARLVQRGSLPDADAIFFLRHDELERLFAGEDLQATLSERRQEHTVNMQISPPPVIFGTFDPSKYRARPEAATAIDGACFQGLGVSPGKVTGRARVITGLEAEGQLLPGEILVAPYADPGWTPHFLQAAAIVVDLGGLLSHGSIIARELGIPSVANVSEASRTIRTGQVLEVDGDRGSVRVVG